MISFITSLLLLSTNVNNFKNNKPKIINMSLENELTKPSLNTDFSKGYDETKMNKTNKVNSEEQIMNIKINYQKYKLLKKLELIKKQNEKYNIDHPNNPLLDNILDSIFIQEMNKKDIWQDLLDEWNNE